VLLCLQRINRDTSSVISGIQKIEIEVLTDEIIRNTPPHHRYLHHLQNTAKEDLDRRLLQNITKDQGKDTHRIPQLQLLRIPHGTLLATQHSQNHLPSMKPKVIGDAKIVGIGTLLSVHIAIAARSKILGEITMTEMIGIIIVVAIEAQIGNNNTTDTQVRQVIMTGDSNMTDRMVKEVVDHMIEEIIQGRDQDQDRMIETITTAGTIVMIEIAIEDRVINKKVV